MNILMNGLNSFTGILIAGTLLKKGHKVIALTSGNEQRLNKNQILQMVNLVSLSNDINELKDNLKCECTKSFHLKT